MQVVGIKFKPVCEIEYFNAGSHQFEKGDAVICETENGMMYGIVEIPSHEQDTSGEYKKVVRLATDGDRKKLSEIHQKEQHALKVAKKLAKSHKLEMKIIDAEYTFDMSKLSLNFTSDGRVDFRELLKSLASEFKTRIELKQIGARDEAKIVGGYGPCGRPLCCANHLKDFGKVSIKMAKNQGLSLNPSGINGMCNRLFCCLSYEENQYEQVLQKMPKLGSKVMTADGEGTVTFNNVLKEEVSVKFVREDGTYTIRDYGIGEIKFERKQTE